MQKIKEKPYKLRKFCRIYIIPKTKKRQKLFNFFVNDLEWGISYFLVFIAYKYLTI